ncbi:MAG: glycan-binding surface protein [Candidatus Symbiothrix sp.]|jgi:hypothetical protein|nr:glycan-binding surface protein [Candidatus Symbiothrix sp.]
MKNKILKNRWIFAALIAGMLGFSSCKDDDNADSGAPAQINKVYLEDAQSNVPDRDLAPYGNFVRLGQTIRLEGSGFVGVTKVLVNGYELLFNPVYVSDKSMIVQVSSKVPVADVDPAYKNKICLVKGSHTTYFDLEVRAAAPSITGISHTMPVAGDPITIYGTRLQGVTSITFPGDVVVTSGIVSDDEAGEWVTVTVPAGVSNDGGSIFIACANGGAYSPAYFNYKKGVLLNFDDVSTWGYSGGEVSGDLDATLPASGDGPKSQGNYRSLNKDGKTIAASESTTPDAFSKAWMNNSKWSPILYTTFSPATSCDQLAVQMDIYFEGTWNSGDIRFVVADGYGVSSYCMIYAPWVSGGARVPFVSPGSWFTVTLPLSESSEVNASNNFAGKTLAELLAIAAAQWDQSGPHMENGPWKGVAAQATDINVYFDNIRFVPLTTPTFSDFPEE